MTLALFFSLYCLEAGCFFLVVPWTRFWTQNPLVHGFEPLTVVLTNFYVRGFVSGFGLVHFLVGLKELVDMIRRARDKRR